MKKKPLATGKSPVRSAPQLPASLAPLLHEGMSKQNTGDSDGAETCYRKVISACPHHYEALHLLGIIEHGHGNLAEAEQLIGQAIALYGGESPYFAMNYGLVLQQLKRFEEADKYFRLAVKKLPESAEAHFNLGQLLQETQRLVEAKQHFKKAVRLNPKHAPSWHNLGKIHDEEHSPDLALECFQKALQAQADFVPSMASLGCTLRDFYRLDESYRIHLRVLELAPENDVALSNIALTCRQMGRMNEAVGYYSRLLMLDLDNFYAHYNLSLLLLEIGDLANGWVEFEYRWRDKRATNTQPRPFPQPRWEGGDLSGKTLLVWGEQGVGDHLRYSSLFPELIAKANKLIVETDPRVIPLFARSFPTVTFVPEKPTPDPVLMGSNIDFQIPMASCTRWLRNRIEDFPAEPAYFVADPEKRRRWTERLQALPNRLKVGISWRSGLTGLGRQFCYADISQWLPIFSVPGIDFINLQYDDSRNELVRLRELGGPELHQWPDIDLKDDFDDVAALVSELDLIISAPISVAELSGGLGIPTWILQLNHVSYVNHGTNGFPWHPSIQLFSREWNEPWEPIIVHIAEKLSSLAQGVPETTVQTMSAAELLNQQGITAYQTGAYEEAIGHFRSAAELAPECPDYPANQGSAHQAQGQHAEAETLFRQALAADPLHANTYFNLGNLFKSQSRFNEAEEMYLKALEMDSEGEGAWNNLGSMWLDGGQPAKAKEAFEQVLLLTPKDYRAHSNLAVALKSLGKISAAEEHFREAIALRPDFAEAHSNLGNLLTGEQRYEEAIDAFLQALELRPDYVDAAYNLGRAYQDDYRLEEARQCFDAVLAQQPENSRALNGLGAVLTQQGKLGEATGLFVQALANRFDDYDAHCNLGQVALQRGDLANGWDGYAQRFQRKQQPVCVRPFPMPWWNGSALAGKSLLVWGEQGVGDEIRFASMIPDAAVLASHCLLECDPRLVSLFARSFPGVHVISRSNPPTAVETDWQCPSGDLARWLRRDFANFSGAPYLRPDPALVARWEKRLAALPPGRRVGFAWRSRNNNRQRSECYPPIVEWLPVFRLPGMVWIDLQYDSAEGEIDSLNKILGANIFHFDDLDLTNDFENVAALMANLDAVVSVATTVPEVAGTIGIPALVVELANFGPMSLGQQNSPWHASRRNFYRTLGEPWQPTIAALAEALSNLQGGSDEPKPLDTPGAVFKEAMARHQAGDLDIAEALYQQVLRSDPHHADALHLSGVLAHQHNRHEQAEQFIRQAIRINSRVSWYYSNLGNVYKAQDRLDAAVIEYRRAIELDSTLADAHYNLANVLREQGLLEGAENHYRLAIANQPENGSFQSNLALVLLQQGKLAEGWRLNDLWRWGASGAELRHRLPQPVWAGESLVDKSIAIWAEQGVGDEIRFASMFSDIIAQAERTVIECDDRLIALFSRSWPRARFVPRSSEPDCTQSDNGISFQSPAGSLGRWLRPDITCFPHTTYLIPNAQRARFWQDRLKALGRGLKVGICWRSHLRTEQRNRSYAEIADWAPVFAIPGAVFVNLQYGDCNDELEQAERSAGITIHRWDDIDLMNDFDEVAALMSGLDLVISAPTAVAEMAGALGLQTWTMFYAYESAMELGTGPTVPWYARMHKFVRAAGQSWFDVLDALAVALHRLTDRSFDLGAVGAKWALAGKKLFEQHKLQEAIGLYRKTLLISPENAQASHLLGVALHQSGLYEPAEKAILAAIPHERNRAMLAVMWSNLGATQQDMGQHKNAEASFRKAAEYNPKHAEAYYNLARLLGLEKRWEEAIALYHKVIELNPNIAEAHNNIGNWLMEQKSDAEAALPYFEKAVALKPKDAINQYNLGKAWHDLFELDQAVACYRQALFLKPDYIKAANNLGGCLRHMGKVDEAMAEFDRVFEINPTDVEARFNTGFVHLLRGDLGQGWDLIEYRWLIPGSGGKRAFPQPWWDGSALAGKRIVVWGDQGVGDEMRAFSMLPDLVARGAEVLVECDHRLASLLRRSFPEVSVYPRGASIQKELRETNIDFQCCASGLARWLRRNLSDFPDRASFFKADDVRRGYWRNKLAALGPGLRVGISWRSRTLSRERRRSYTSLEQWGPIFSIPGIHFINLQYDQCEEDLVAAEDRFGISIHRWPELDLMNDLNEVAALNVNLDLVITAPTAVGELSGALGVPTWTMLLKHESIMDLGTGGMPWEPSVKLYYRNWDDAWERIIGIVAEDLLERMAEQPSNSAPLSE
ncbi:MAG: tetratricopeptide repeat protein [Sterolibacterium sp.]